MGTSSARRTSRASDPDWNRAQRASKKALKARTRDTAQTALLEFTKARKGLAGSGTGQVKIPLGDLAGLLNALLAFLQTVETKGLKKALDEAGIQLAEKSAVAALSLLLDKLLEDWPPLARDLVRTAVLAAAEAWLDAQKDDNAAKLGIAIFAPDAGSGNALNELLANILVKLYLQEMREYLSRKDQDNQEQKALDKNLLDAARKVVAEHIFSAQDELDEATWGTDLSQALLKGLLDKLHKELGGK